MGKILRFAVLIGLRPAEVCESVSLICKSTDKYYNPERQALEHFKFPEIFLRQTKKAYISFVTPEMLKKFEIEQILQVSSRNAITYSHIRYACWSAGIKCYMRYCRKIFASWLRKEGIAPEIVDLLQGRVSQSILTRHYLSPLQNMKDDVLQALEKLQSQLN